jgi:Ca2+-transporting ATPase
MSIVAIVFVTELEFCQRVFDTVALTGNQWLICIGAAATIIVASELRKFLLRRHQGAVEHAPELTADHATEVSS